MLGIRLDAAAEARLARYAQDAGQPKSMIARDWILERLDRDEFDRKIRDAAALHAADREDCREQEATDGWLRLLDAEDGGYDWGPAGPPDVK